MKKMLFAIMAGLMLLLAADTNANACNGMSACVYEGLSTRPADPVGVGDIAAMFIFYGILGVFIFFGWLAQQTIHGLGWTYRNALIPALRRIPRLRIVVLPPSE